jgi:hypothetical protein
MENDRTAPMTRKKRNTGDDYDWDEVEPEDENQRKGGLRRHRDRRKSSKDSLEISDTPWAQPPKKGDKKNG